MFLTAGQGNSSGQEDQVLTEIEKEELAFHATPDPSQSSSDVEISEENNAIFDRIPSELIQTILTYLPIQDLAMNVCLVNKLWKALADDSAIWKALYFNHFSLEIASNENWKNRFKEMFQFFPTAEKLLNYKCDNFECKIKTLEVSHPLLINNKFINGTKKVIDMVISREISIDRRGRIYPNHPFHDGTAEVKLGHKKKVKNLMIENALIKRKTKINYSLMLNPNDESLNNMSSEEKDLVNHQLAIIEKIMNKKLKCILQDVYKHNNELLCQIQVWDIPYHICLDKNSRIVDIYKKENGHRLIRLNFPDISNNEREQAESCLKLKCLDHAGEKIFRWKYHKCINISRENKSITYAVMDKTINALSKKLSSRITLNNEKIAA